MQADRFNIYIQIAIALGLVIAINVIASLLPMRLDLTEDKRFTLTNASIDAISAVDEPIYIKVLLEGKFPAGFKRLRNATEDMIQDLQRHTDYISYDFEDPNQGSTDQINNTYQKLKERGIQPMRLSYLEGDQKVDRIVFPYAIATRGKFSSVINLLEEQVMGVDEEVTINNSISLLEYKFANAIQKLTLEDRKNIVFTTGHGEHPEPNTYRLEGELKRYYNTARINLDSIVTISDQIDMVIIAGPDQPFSLKDQFKIDQYIMQGGKVVFLIDQLRTPLDSVAYYGSYTVPVTNHGLDDLLFKYGVRIEPALIMDLECSELPQVVGTVGDRPQIELKPWYFHPLLNPQLSHPVTKNIGQVNVFFPNIVSTLELEKEVTATTLLTSSPYSRYKYVPIQLTTALTQVDADPALFDKGPQPIAVLLQGTFNSAFTNRVSEEFQQTLASIGSAYRSQSNPSSILVMSDSDFIRNRVDPSNNRTSEIGLNQWSNKLYKGNQNFILNVIEYMINPSNVLTARSKEVKLRLLDAVRTKQEKRFWQALNIGLPLLVLAMAGVGFHFWRRRRYA